MNTAFDNAKKEIQEMTDKAHSIINKMYERDMKAFSSLNPYLYYLGINQQRGYFEVRDENDVVRVRIGLL